MNVIKINVSFKNRTIYKSGVDLTSGDYNTTKLVFTFDRQDGRKVFEMKDEDGNLVLITDIINNEVELVGKDENGKNASLFKQEGKYIFEISLYDRDSKLTSAFDFIKVKQEQVEIDGEVITPYLPIFDELVNEVEKIKNTIKTDGNGTKYLSDDGTYKFVQGGGTGEGGVKEVHIGTNEPTGDEVIWIDPSEEADIIPTKTSQLENDSKFVNEDYVDKKISEINVEDIDLSEYAKKTDIPDVSNLAKKSEIPSIEGLATEEYVNTAIQNALEVVENGTY